MEKIYLKKNVPNLDWIVVDDNGIIVECSEQSYLIDFQILRNSNSVCIYKNNGVTQYIELVEIEKNGFIDNSKPPQIIRKKSQRVDIEKLKNAVADNPHATMRELAKMLGNSYAPVYRSIKKHNIPYKNKTRSAKRD